MTSTARFFVISGTLLEMNFFLMPEGLWEFIAAIGVEAMNLLAKKKGKMPTPLRK